MGRVYGFPEDDARRIVRGVSAFEKFTQRNKNPASIGRTLVKVTGAGTSNPAPPAAFACKAGRLVAADDTDASGFVEVSADGLFIIYLTAEGDPPTDKVLEADLVWTDDDGVGVYLVRQGGGGTCIDVDTSDTFTITIPGQVTSWTGSIGPPPDCTLTLTPATYADDTVITIEGRLAGNTCDELALTFTEV